MDVKDQLKSIPIKDILHHLGFTLKHRNGTQGDCPFGHESQGG